MATDAAATAATEVMSAARRAVNVTTPIPVMALHPVTRSRPEREPARYTEVKLHSGPGNRDLHTDRAGESFGWVAGLGRTMQGTPVGALAIVEVPFYRCGHGEEAFAGSRLVAGRAIRVRGCHR